LKTGENWLGAEEMLNEFPAKQWNISEFQRLFKHQSRFLNLSHSILLYCNSHLCFNHCIFTLLFV